MNTPFKSVRLLVIGPAVAIAVATGCVASVGGGGRYDDSVDVSYGVGFYEPYGYDYGGWGPGYRVGPSRGGENRRDRAGRAYHAPQPSRRTPSIPTHSRPHR
jgi:hypothetical protein